MAFLGLGKTLFNSSACLMESDEIELLLTERLSRRKASGAWPEMALRQLRARHGLQAARIAENRDVVRPARIEEGLDRAMPFFAYLDRQGLARFTSRGNAELEFVPHHLCHAYAAAWMSPFEKCAILVIDGAGTAAEDFSPAFSEAHEFAAPGPRWHEEHSVYLFDRGQLRAVKKAWQEFAPGTRRTRESLSEGLGMLYEKIAEYIFRSPRAAGKVMGLAALGRPHAITGRRSYLDGLSEALAFEGKDRQAWEDSDRLPYFADIAASVQSHFEESVLAIACEIRDAHPEYRHLILTGGCALNCTTNMKIVEQGWFDGVYVPPFPGDESIGLGAAAFTRLARHGETWRPRPPETQHGYFGAVDSVPTEREIQREFAGCEIHRPESIASHAADRLAAGEIIGWCQGRSETGPRALGNRSLLARPDQPGLRARLNSRVKFRESFRPYGCSVLHDDASTYFEVPPGFDNPFMAFATRVRMPWQAPLSEVTHADGRSRMQTVRESQNARFYRLLSEFRARVGFSCLLNTSLNVMGEPIVETARDARRFLDASDPREVSGIAVGDFFISKRATK